MILSTTSGAPYSALLPPRAEAGATMAARSDVGIDPEHRFCHLFTQSVAQLSPPVSSTKALNNFQYWDMSCHCGAMTSAPPTTLRSPISTTTQPSRAVCKALCGAALYCQSYSYNSVGGTCLFWNWSLFNAATLVWDATGTWTSYDHNCP
jgi:hypothetical protein